MMYDPKVIEKFAEKLYSRAATVHVVCIFLGLAAGLVVQRFIAHQNPMDVSTALFAGVGAIVGFMYGRSRSFWMVAKAQQALCQMHIERNTRAIRSVGDSVVDRLERVTE